MAIFRKETSKMIILAGLLAAVMIFPLYPVSCRAEENTAPDEETFAIPGKDAVWTSNGNPAGKELTWNEALDYLDGLNTKKFGGCANWRLPSRGELADMLAFLNSGNAADEVIFPEEDYYWSATTDPFDNSQADAVNMDDGSVDSCDKSEYNYVWPLCGES